MCSQASAALSSVRRWATCQCCFFLGVHVFVLPLCEYVFVFSQFFLSSPHRSAPAAAAAGRPPPEQHARLAASTPCEPWSLLRGAAGVPYSPDEIACVDTYSFEPCIVCRLDDSGGRPALLACDRLDCPYFAHGVCAAREGHPTEGGDWDAFFCSSTCLRMSQRYFDRLGHGRVRSDQPHGRCYQCQQFHTVRWHPSPQGRRSLCDVCGLAHARGTLRPSIPQR